MTSAYTSSFVVFVSFTVCPNFCNKLLCKIVCCAVDSFVCARACVSKACTLSLVNADCIAVYHYVAINL